jgi:hypothetical protein
VQAYLELVQARPQEHPEFCPEFSQAARIRIWLPDTTFAGSPKQAEAP